jgi:dTDP-D-glucose 4,6-dehydratase
MTNVVGTVNLLNAAKENWSADYTDKLFYHVSTDEVYGSLGETGFLQKQRHMIRVHPILHLRQVQIILYVLMKIPIIYRL